MARSASRKSGLFSRLWSVPRHGILAADQSVGAVTNTAKGVVGSTLRGLNRIGSSVSGHANQAVRNLISRKNRKNRKHGGASRKNRKDRKDRKDRKNRKSTRKNRKDRK